MCVLLKFPIFHNTFKSLSRREKRQREIQFSLTRAYLRSISISFQGSTKLRTREKNSLNRYPLSLIATRGITLRIARQISACIPTLSAPAAWLPWFLRDVIPPQTETNGHEYKEAEREERNEEKIGIRMGGGKGGRRCDQDGTSFARAFAHSRLCTFLIRTCVYVRTCAQTRVSANASFR